jgi:ATP-dependent Clp endopeptidase proteolytic subunit ClpP
MQPSKPNLRMSANDGDGEILIYDDIGPSWAGMISAEWFDAEIKKLGKLSRVRVKINSYGGEVFEGLGIYNTLKDLGAYVTTEVVGIAASISSVIYEAGDRRVMAENSMLMIHNPWTYAAGEEEDLRAQADVLAMLKVSIIGTYTARNGKGTSSEIRALMKAATWMDAKEAGGRGFVDEVLPNKSATAAAARPAARSNLPQRNALVARWQDRIKQAAPPPTASDSHASLDYWKAHPLPPQPSSSTKSVAYWRRRLAEMEADLGV